MTSRQPDRRRFLAWIGTTLGVAGLGAAGVRLARAGSTTTTIAAAQASGVLASSPSDVEADTSTVTSPAAAPTFAPAADDTTTSAPTTGVETQSTTTVSTAVPPIPAPAGAVTVICRASWGAREPGEGLVGHTIERLTVHHTAALLADNSRAPAEIRRHQRFHMDDRGWPDLAYHFVIDGHGYAYEGRDLSKVGDTATSYDPTGHFLVCLEGNFDDQDVPGAQMATLVNVLAWASSRYGVAAETISGHRDHANTTCPGANLYASIDDGSLREAVDMRLTEGPPTLQTACGEDGDALVGRIVAGTA